MQTVKTAASDGSQLIIDNILIKLKSVTVSRAIMTLTRDLEVQVKLNDSIELAKNYYYHHRNITFEIHFRNLLSNLYKFSLISRGRPSIAASLSFKLTVYSMCRELSML